MLAPVMEGVRNAAAGLKGRAISGPHGYEQIAAIVERSRQRKLHPPTTTRAIRPVLCWNPPCSPHESLQAPAAAPLGSNHPTGKASVAAPQDSHGAGMGSLIQFARRGHRQGSPTAPAGHQGGNVGSRPPGTPGESHTAAGTCPGLPYLPPSRPPPATLQSHARATPGAAVREGSALLQGLANCGHCGRRLKTHYRGRNATPATTALVRSSSRVVAATVSTSAVCRSTRRSPGPSSPRSSPPSWPPLLPPPSGSKPTLRRRSSNGGKPSSGRPIGQARGAALSCRRSRQPAGHPWA